MREFGRDERVQGGQRRFRLKFHDNVGVREAPFLKLDHANLIEKAPEVLTEERLQFVDASVEGAVDHGRGVEDGLAPTEFFLDLGPQRVRRHGQPEGRLAQLASDGERIGDLIGTPGTGAHKASRDLVPEEVGDRRLIHAGRLHFPTLAQVLETFVFRSREHVDGVLTGQATQNVETGLGQKETTVPLQLREGTISSTVFVESPAWSPMRE